MTTSSELVSNGTAGPRVALVTGANKGIGRAIASGLAREGFVVYLGARDSTRGAAAAGELAVSGDVRFLLLDVTSDADVAAAVARVESDFGHLDVLVNNAGVNAGYNRPEDETADGFRFVYETNVFAVVRVTNGFLPLLRKSAAGRIVNVTSKRGSIGEPGAWVGRPSMAYSSSKTALNAITVHYARELARPGRADRRGVRGRDAACPVTAAGRGARGRWRSRPIRACRPSSSASPDRRCG
jgi:NAD(P)-dependent dehydrogenase (short-subunit alcohol dehydrogenase family)